jgi:hypothetical protein
MPKKNIPPVSGGGISPAPSPGLEQPAWNQSVAREIALNETLVADAALTDTLGGPKVQLISQAGRDLYIRRCTKDAGTRGHPCSPSKLPADSDTKVEEVGDALFKFAKP